MVREDKRSLYPSPLSRTPGSLVSGYITTPTPADDITAPVGIHATVAGIGVRGGAVAATGALGDRVAVVRLAREGPDGGVLGEAPALMWICSSDVRACPNTYDWLCCRWCGRRC